MKKLLIIGSMALLTASSVFAEDAYIESDGTNTVNIGYYANPKTKIVIDFKLNEVARNYDTVLGHYNNDFSVLIYCPGTDFQLEAKDGGHSTLHMSPQIMGDTARHTAVIDAPGRHAAMYAADGTLEGEADFPSTWTLTKTSNWPFLLFGSSQNTSGAARQCVKARIYAVKIYEKENGVETLVRDLVPCLKGDRVGFYDMANGIVYGGQGSLKGLAHGGDGIMKLQDDGYLATPSSNKSSAHITFNTGYCMTHDSRIEVDFQWLGNPADLLFGAWRDSQLCTGFWINSDAFSFLLNDGGYKAYNSTIGKDNYRHTAVVDVKNGSYSLKNDSGFVQYSGTIAANATCNNDALSPLLLFGNAKNTSGDPEQWSYARIFSAKIYTNDTVLVKDFEPYVKDGAAGFMEKVSGTFTAISGIIAGGKIETHDAYIVNNGTTSLNLGYLANMRSRIEVDYQSLDASAGKLVFGSWAAGSLRYAFWCDSNGNKIKFIFHGNSANDPQYVTSFSHDNDRHTAVMDMNNQMMYYITGNTTNYSQQATAGTFSSGDASTIPLAVWGYIASNGNPAMQATARIFSVRIYEDEELIREFLPYTDTDGTTVSLRDVITGHVATKVKSDSANPTISGIGVDGAERCVVLPQNASISKGQTVTLKAIAAGAVSRYKWTLNGEAVSGGANGELEVSWRRTKTPDVYAVTPVYSLAGAEVEGAAVYATVENKPQGMIVILR